MVLFRHTGVKKETVQDSGRSQRKMNKKYVKIYLPDVVGKGYKNFWNFKGRYRIVKGSRASKKSKTTALWIIYNMMKFQDANTLVIRKTFRTLKDSCYTELKWAINRLHVDHLWDCKESPLEMTYKPTGQKIYFRGLDDPLKVTSITVEHGFLCWMFFLREESHKKDILQKCQRYRYGIGSRALECSEQDPAENSCIVRSLCVNRYHVCWCCC